MPVPYIHAQTHLPGGADPLFGLVSGAGTPNYYLNSSGIYVPLATGGSTKIYVCEHFLTYSGNASPGAYSFLTVGNSGGTGAVSWSITVTSSALTGYNGVLQLAPGTSATSQYSRAFANPQFVYSGQTITMRVVCNPLNSLSGSRTQHWIGLSSVAGPVLSSSDFRIGFYLIRSISDNWVVRVINGSGSLFQDIDTGIVASNATWFDLVLVASQTECLFYINGALVALVNNTAFIPASTQLLFPLVSINDGGGGSNATLYADSVELLIDTAGSIPIIPSNAPATLLTAV